MIDELRALTSFAKSRRVHIESIVFRMHCRVTTVALIIALMVVSSKTFVNSPIYCDVAKQSSTVSKEVIDNFCYLNSIYTIYSVTNRSKRHSNDFYNPYPGIEMERPEYEQTRVNFTYYQWMWVIYFMQALAFYFPSWVWKTLEGGRLRALVKDLDVVNSTHESREYDQLVRIAHYVVASFGSNRRYMLAYYGCELLAVGNILLQAMLLHALFAGQFLSFGWDQLVAFIGQGYPYAHDPMTYMFPKMSKCDYLRYGPTGGVDRINALCVLPLNHFNDKLYLLLWCWMMLLMALFVSMFIYRLGQMFCAKLRSRCLCRQVPPLEQSPILLRGVDALLNKIQIGDWFFLTMIGWNVDRVVFYFLLTEVVTTYLEGKSNANQDNTSSKHGTSLRKMIAELGDDKQELLSSEP